MQVDACRADVSMAQHRLNLGKIETRFEQCSTLPNVEVRAGAPGARFLPSVQVELSSLRT
jgi:hypothetical protein